MTRSKAHSRHSARRTYCNIFSHIIFFSCWVSLVSQMIDTLPADAGEPGSVPGLGRYLGGRNGNPFQYSCLENSVDREAWQAIVHGVSKSQTQLSN